MHEGHRKRMLQRLEHAEGLQDHEVLEILLYNAIPRKNTNPLAHALLNAFPSLEQLFRASYEELLTVDGVGPETAAYLRCIGILRERIPSSEEAAPAAFGAGNFSAYLLERYSSLKEEVIEIFCMDAQERVHSSKRFTRSLADRGRFLRGGRRASFVGQAVRHRARAQSSHRARAPLCRGRQVHGADAGAVLVAQRAPLRPHHRGNGRRVQLFPHRADGADPPQIQLVRHRGGGDLS